MIASLDKAAAGVGEVKSVLRACAEDLAASLAKLKYLKALVGPFAVCEAAVGLTLKPKKCKLVVLEPWSTRVQLQIKSYMVEQIPQWSCFEIVPYAKYLGFLVGPGASSLDNFAAPSKKIWSRVLSMASAPGSCHADAVAANREATPTLGYVAQLIAPPKELINLQCGFNSKISKLPYRALVNVLPGLQHCLGINVPQHLESLCFAIRFRTANKTLQGWKNNYNCLAEAHDSLGSVVVDSAGSANNLKSPGHWKTQPFAQALKEVDFVEPFEEAYSSSLAAKLPLHLHRLLADDISNPKTSRSLQSTAYKCFVEALANSSVAGAIKRHNFRHLRKEDTSELLHELCDKLCSDVPHWLFQFRSCKNKYGILSLVKFCTDTHCTARRFGQLSICPFCKEEGTSFSVAHLSKCAEVLKIIISLCDGKSIDIVLKMVADLPDKRYWIVNALNCTETSTKHVILEIFALFAVVVGNGLHDPAASPHERVEIISTRQA